MASASNVHHLLQQFLVNSNDESRSKEAFLKRLATFSLMTWGGKTADTSPLQCARYGWCNSDADFLKCTSCDSLVCGKLPKRSQIDLYKISVAKLKTELTDAHHKLCPWRNNPSPETYYNIARWSKEEMQSEFLTCVSLLNSLETNLPNLHDEHVTLIEESLENLQGTCNNVKLTLPIAQLALRGWSCNTDGAPGCPSLFCAYCVRCVGLWNYHTDIENCDIPVKKRKYNEDTVERKAVDPVLEHQLWCPWISVSQETNEPGWKTFLQTLTSKVTKLEQGKTESNAKPHLCQIRKWLTA